MIARDDGRVIFVSGAIPGESVTAYVERVGRDVAHARTVAVHEASSDRREVNADPACGGCLYAHIAYPRQLTIKAEVIADGFKRIARVVLPTPVTVSASPEEGYRMRARFHVRNCRAGFFREGTHDLCDPRGTRQLLAVSCDVVDRVSAMLGSISGGGGCEIELSENVDATERVVHVHAPALDEWVSADVAIATGLTGLSAGSSTSSASEVPAGRHSMQTHASSEPAVTLAGDPSVTDMITIAGAEITLRRHVLTFFQGNRYLLRDLVAHVVDHIDRRSRVVDLYAGAGLFAIAAAVVREARVTAVEGERCAALDLAANSEQAAARVVPVHQAVESFVRQTRPSPDTLIIDPPRTGMSSAAIAGALALGARRIVYVSCDIATLARDTRRLLDSGYAIENIRAFDLFPNTPHVETVVVFRSVTATA
jgi:23S rRNA (uracil1939-C5)-methyltransferase